MKLKAEDVLQNINLFKARLGHGRGDLERGDLERRDMANNVAFAAKAQALLRGYAEEIARLKGREPSEWAVGDKAVIDGLEMRIIAQRSYLDALMGMPYSLFAGFVVFERDGYILMMGGEEPIRADVLMYIADRGAKVEQHLGLDNCWKVTA